MALGETEAEAEVELRNMLVALDRSTFLRPSEARNMPIKESAVPRLTIEQLCNRFCTDKRATRGKKTAGTYLSRLKWLIAFADGEEVKRKWDCALHIDRDFVVTFRKYLFRQLVTPNGHPASVELPAGPRFVFNVLTAVAHDELGTSGGC